MAVRWEAHVSQRLDHFIIFACFVCIYMYIYYVLKTQWLTVMYKFVIPAQINNIMSRFETGREPFWNVQIRQIIFGFQKVMNSHIYIASVLLDSLFEVVGMVRFPFRNGTGSFETGSGPFQQLQIIYCFQNLFVQRLYLYKERSLWFIFNLIFTTTCNFAR